MEMFHLQRGENQEMEMFHFHAMGPVGIGIFKSGHFLMCKNMAKEVRMKKMNLVPIMALQSSATVANGHLPDKWHDPETVAGTRLEAWDDLTGLSLDPKGVLEARQKELDYIEKKEVWEIVSRDKAIANGWNIIESRWIDVNKGDDISVSYRSRLVLSLIHI